MLKTPFTKTFLYSALTILLLADCSKQGDPNIIRCPLTSEVITSSTTTRTYTISYDGQKATKVNMILGASEYLGSITYDNNGNISEINYPGSRHVFTYADGVITKKQEYTSDNVLRRQADYEYSNGQLIKIQLYYEGSGGLTKGDYKTIEYANTSSKDPLRVRDFYSPTSTTPVSISEFTYGDKHEPYSASSPALLKWLRLTGQPMEKNVTKTTFSNGAVINYSYEFNADGYPTKRTEIHTLYPTVTTSTRDYTYGCN